MMTTENGIHTYHKKPDHIEALLWDGKNMQEVITFGGGKCAVKPIEKIVLVSTREGTRVAVSGDYIIKGSTGEYYPCRPDIFEKTYYRV